MAILDTFYLVFKSLGASGTKADLDKLNESTERLDKTLAKTGKTTHEVTGYFQGLAAQVLSIATGIVTLGTILNQFSKTTSDIANLSNLSDQLNVNISDLDAWGRAVQRGGGTIQGFQSSLQNLAQHLGVSASGALRVLPQLADVFQRLGKYRSQQYGKMLGLDQGTILLLQQGRREVEDLIRRQKEFGVVTKQDKEISREFTAAVSDTGSAFRYLFVVLERDLLPILTSLLNKLRPVFQYLIEHKNLVIGAFLGIAAAAAIMAAPIIAANAALLATIAVVGGLIAIFAIAYEDIKAFSEGHSSLIGDILKKWPIVGAVVGDIIHYWISSLKTLLELLSAVSNGLIKLVFHPKEFVKDLVVSAKGFLDTAQNSVINAFPTSNTLLNTANNGGNFSFGDINITTTGTDGKGIAQDFLQQVNYQAQLRQTTDYFANGQVN